MGSASGAHPGQLCLLPEEHLETYLVVRIGGWGGGKGCKVEQRGSMATGIQLVEAGDHPKQRRPSALCWGKRAA